MTTSTATEVDARKQRLKPRPRNMASSLAAACFAAATAVGAMAAAMNWPSPHYRADPVAFFREVLGTEPWDKQIEVIEGIRDYKRVAVKAGHKVSKSHTIAGIALWFYASFDDARVVLTSTTSRQVDQILWRELKMMHARSGRCVACKLADKERIAQRESPGPRPCPHSALLDGQPPVLARTGIKSEDFREIVGFTAREAEAVAGISGKNLLYLPDEASGIADAIFEAIEGNRAGGARIAMFSNPTRSSGEFFDAFFDKAEHYRTYTISSEDSPNVRAGREIIPGLATREWVEEKKREWGEDSALYKVRVKGEFVLNEDGKILSVHAIGESEKRWIDTSEDGRLHIGLDPAGPGQGGDETVFALRRGQKILGLLAFRGQTEDAIVVHLLGILKAHAKPREPLPIVKVDREGSVGAKVFGMLRASLEATSEEARRFELVGVRSSERAIREPMIYDRVRDELWASLALWMREGGAIVEDVKLAKELHAPEWSTAVTGRLKVTAKEELRKTLGRSPDRADACTLAVWEIPSLEVGVKGGGGGSDEGTEAQDASGPYDLPGIDPYALDGRS